MRAARGNGSRLARSATSSTPTIRPRPRISPTAGWVPNAAVARSRSRSPLTALASTSDSLSMMRRTSRATAAPTGACEYVKPWTNKIILTLQADTEILDSYCDNQMIMQAHYSMGPPPAEPPSPPLPAK